MSVNSDNKSQSECMTACPTGTTHLDGASTVHHVPKRTTYRVKISNSKDLEALSTAAKLGLSSWVGGQKVRIVGIAQKQFSEKSRGSKSESYSSCVLSRLDTSRTHTVCSAVSQQSRCHPVCCTPSMSPVTHCQTTHVVSHMPSQSCVASTCQSLLVSSHSQPRDSFKPAVDTGVSYLHHRRTESSNSLVSHCLHSGQGLPRKVRYLGTVAVNTKNYVDESSSQSVGSSSGHSLSQASVISAVKTCAERMYRNKLLNGKQLNGKHLKNNHSQPLNQSQNLLGISARCLKRPYIEDDKTTVVSAKRMAHSVKSFVGNSKVHSFSEATNSGAHSQQLTSIAPRLVNVSQYTQHSVKNSQQTAEVNNNCSGLQRLTSNLVPKLKLSPGSGMISDHVGDCDIVCLSLSLSLSLSVSVCV